MSIADYIPRKHREEDMAETPGVLRGGVPYHQPAPSRRPWTQAAAEAAQRWEELEQDLQQHKAQLDSANARIEVQERTIDLLKIENNKLSMENKSLHRENAVVQDRVRTCCDILISMRQPPDTKASDEGQKAVAAALDVIDTAIGEPSHG